MGHTCTTIRLVVRSKCTVILDTWEGEARTMGAAGMCRSAFMVSRVEPIEPACVWWRVGGRADSSGLFLSASRQGHVGVTSFRHECGLCA